MTVHYLRYAVQQEDDGYSPLWLWYIGGLAALMWSGIALLALHYWESM